MRKKTGIKFATDDETLALAMGQTKQGLNLLELTASYLPAAKEGLYIEPVVLTKVEDANGRNALNIQKSTSQRVLTEQEAYLLTNMLFPPRAEAEDLDFEAALHVTAAEDGKANGP